MKALLVLIYLAFISLGLPDGILGVAWPAIRADLHEPLAAVGLISMTLTVSASLTSWRAAPVLARLGPGRVVAASSLLTACALAVFSLAPSLPWLVAMAVPLGVGAGVVDVALNHFVAEHYASRHMNWLHACWGIGASTGPLIMGLTLALPEGWRLGVQVLAGMQLALSLVLWASLRLWAHAPQAPVATDAPAAGPAARPVPHSARWFAPLCFFLYVSVEVGAGLWAASVLVGERGLGKAEASLWVSLYYGAITCGRMAIGVLAHHLSNRQWIVRGLWLALAGLLCFIAAPPAVAPWGLLLLGLGCAPVFPGMMHETPRRFESTQVVPMIGRQMMASYAGGALTPALLGLLASALGLVWVMPSLLVLLVLLGLALQKLDRIS